jgi:[CysO sulfur-carrier protein]-S-L-cysteine hydrolase
MRSEERGLTMLRITREVLDAMIAHAQKEAPLEACGYLAEKDGVASLMLPLTNIDASPEHFSLDPKEQFCAVRRIRADGFRQKAVYHSHPATPARPSQEDIRLAYDPHLSYVIVSLAGEATVKSFTIRNGIAEEEMVEII